MNNFEKQFLTVFEISLSLLGKGSHTLTTIMCSKSGMELTALKSETFRIFLKFYQNFETKKIDFLNRKIQTFSESWLEANIYSFLADTNNQLGHWSDLEKNLLFWKTITEQFESVTVYVIHQTRYFHEFLADYDVMVSHFMAHFMSHRSWRVMTLWPIFR